MKNLTENATYNSDSTHRYGNNSSNDRYNGHDGRYADIPTSEAYLLGKVPPSSQALAQASDAIGTSEKLPALEIHIDDYVRYFADHSMTIDTARRVAYDFERKPAIAAACWGSAAISLATAIAAGALLKNPAALNNFYVSKSASVLAKPIEREAERSLNFYAMGGAVGGTSMQTIFTVQQLSQELPSSHLPEFKAVRF